MKMYEEEIQVCGPELELSVVRTSPAITSHPFKPWGLLSSETRGLLNHRAQQSSQWCRAVRPVTVTTLGVCPGTCALLSCPGVSAGAVSTVCCCLGLGC